MIKYCFCKVDKTSSAISGAFCFKAIDANNAVARPEDTVPLDVSDFQLSNA